jgi:glycosyltransferase involved in cell wall biosynthesis
VRLQFTLVCDGSERRSLEALAQQINPTAVHFLPLQPSELFPQILAAADALLLNQRANVTDSVAPSKLLSYMAAGRPVLAAVHECSEAARVLTDANCGLLTPPEDPAALAQGITQLATNPTLRAELAANGRRFVIKHYERELVLQQYESLLLALASSGHHSNHRNRSI